MSPTTAVPEPVLDQARIVSVVTGVLTAVLTLAAVLGYATTAEGEAITTVVLAVVGAVVTAVNTVVPILRARIAREQVTPWPLRPAIARDAQVRTDPPQQRLADPEPEDLA